MTEAIFDNRMTRLCTVANPQGEQSLIPAWPRRAGVSTQRR